MNKLKSTIIACLTMLVVAAFGIGPPTAHAIDEAKIPHYFGPYPNWALSPLPVVNPDGTITGGIRKFVDGLPRLGPGGANNLGQYLPVAVPDTTTYPGSDYYVIGLVQYREKMHSDLPGTLLRGYVQLSTDVVPGAQVPLSNVVLDGTVVPIAGYTGVSAPHYLGPIIVAKKDRPVRILFRNLLPTGAGGDLFLPVDSTLMGSGMGPGPIVASADLGAVTDEVRNPLCTQSPKSDMCFKDNRATLHLHGGVTPWISDGTPHQWITPADENTPWPKGVTAVNVPDMPDPGPGAMTFFYTNQQSARLMFYHDHSWGITRLNVYSGEAGGYLITDDTEKALVNAGLIPGAADTLPLIVQDRTFVPQGDKTTRTGQLYEQDPTWDENRWGGFGNFWYHHVYMPAQNPGDPGGMSAYGRWMYGPWFWPPAKDAQFGPIANPRHNMDPATNFTTPLATPCNLEDPATWQYQVDPFCEPEMIPGTPNISAGMEQFNDTPLVNGTVYPTTTVDPKPYRLRILNAANDRFFNLQLYVADSTGTEVALKADELAAAQLDPVVFPTPDTNVSPAGPDWIQIGTEGGFLPAPAVIPSQPITWITDPTRFDVGNVDQHSLLLAPAERADVIVDFSKYAGKTLILYNDAPAAFPARVSTYDYYTGSPDLSPNGAPGVLPGYGPNTRTVMQIKVAAATPAPAFNLAALQAAFTHQPDGTGVFESGQHPIIVGQAAYNSAYGTNFAASSWCNGPRLTTARCDGFARISDQGGDLFGFNTLLAPLTKFQIPLQPKAIHDEMNSVSFDEFGRMTANLGIETVPATPGNQNVTLYPYTNPVTEIIDASNLPKTTSVTPIATQDGTQLWKITHNGVDTHPIHFHLYDVQVVNRVTWDNIVLPPDANELGWKDTVRISPLEDTIVAIRPIIPTLPFEIPNSIHALSPMMQLGETVGFNNIDINGNPTDPITNRLVNFGWEYVFHCHILSHEEMDMMRPVSVALPPNKPDGLQATVNGAGDTATLVLSWNDNSITETAYVVQKTTDGGATWTDIGTSLSPLDEPNTIGIRSLTEPGTYNPDATATYRVVAQNTVGYGGQFPAMTVTSVSDPLVVGAPLPPAAPGPPQNVTAVAGNGQATVAFTPPAFDGGSVVTSYTVTSNPGNLTQTGTASPITVAGLTNGTRYTFTVTATNAVGTGLPSAASNQVTPATVPDAPTIGTVTPGDTRVTVAFTPPVSNGGSAVLFYTATSTPGGITATGTASPIVVPGLTNGTAYTFTVTATNAVGTGAASAASASATPLGSFPGAPIIGTATPGPGQATVSFSPPLFDGGFPVIEYIVTSSPGNFTAKGPAGPLTVTGLTNGTAYTFTVTARNISATGPASNPSNSVVPVSVPGAPTMGIVTGGNGQAAVFFTPSAFNSGTPDIIYTVTSNTGAKTTGIVSPIYVTGLTNGTPYTFTVTTTNAVGTSAPSASSVIVTPATVPDAPTGVTAVAGNTTAVVTFTPPVSNGGSAITLYTVTASPGGLTAQGTQSPITLTGLTNGTTYTFTVTAANNLGTGPSSLASNIVTPTATRPTAPSTLVAAASPLSADPPSITISWRDRSANEAAFILERATNSTFTTGLTTVTLDANTTTYVDTAVVARTRYYYRVRAINAVGASANSNTVNVTPHQRPADPNNPAVASKAIVSATRGSITISWTDNAANESGFYIQRSTTPNGPWSRIATVAANTAPAPSTSSYTNTGLTRNRTYWYRVQAYNADGTSGFTLPVGDTTP